MNSRISFDPPLEPEKYSFVHQVRVRFAETDAMGIVHHGSYVPYLESARVEFLRHIGHDYVSVRAAGINFAVIECALQYLKPCVFDDLIDVYLLIGPRTKATFQIGYLLTVGGEPRVKAVTVHASVTDAQRPARLPRWLLEL